MQLMPIGRQQFTDSVGAPLDGGQVYFYAPGTTTPAATWSDEAGTVLNPNPIVLDAAGEAVIWGDASYHQVVKDAAGNTVWEADVAVPASREELSSADGGSMIGFSSVGGELRTVQAKLQDAIYAADFPGVYPAGDQSSTTGLQAFIDYCRVNHCVGYFGRGTFMLTGALSIPASHDWGLRGEAYGGTILRQSADNVPVFLFGSDNSTVASYNVLLEDIGFEYQNVQDSSMSLGCPIYFQTMWFHVGMHRLVFNGGRYGIKVKGGVGAPWGCVWDDLTFGGKITGGAMDWTGAVNAVPNNKWGRLVVTATNMEGPLFNALKGYNWVIGTIETLDTQLGAQLIMLQAGSRVNIGAVKLENGRYTAAQNLFNFATNSFVHIGQLSLGGTGLYLTPATGSLNILNTSSGGTTGSLDVEQIVAQATTLTGNVFLVNGSGGSMRIRHLTLDSNNWRLTNAGSSTTPETLTVEDWDNGHVSQPLGDADYIVALTGPTVLDFSTPFTALRTIALPDALNNLFNGCKRIIRFKGAINGANTAKVTCNGAVLNSFTSDGFVVEYTWRRATPVQNGWIITAYNVFF